jgi:ABC-type antimicrobial peptide transport system permease subunit
MPEQIREVMLPDLLLSRLSTALALLATALATLGLYGMMAHSVAERSKEIGVRIALGAGLRRIRVMVVQRALRAVAIGGGIGLLGAYIIGRAMEALLFQTNGTDPRVFTVSVAVLGFAAAFAAYIPARRASSLDPMVALRSD